MSTKSTKVMTDMTRDFLQNPHFSNEYTKHFRQKPFNSSIENRS